MNGKITNDGEPIRIAQIVGKAVKGGVESVINNYYRGIDHKKIQFDYFVDADSVASLPDDILASGAQCFIIPPYQKLPSYIMSLVRLFRRNHYQIVHVNMNTLSVFALFAAWIVGVPVRISHNHSSAHKGEGRRIWLKYLLRPFAKMFATDFFACSIYAGEWLFGRKAVRDRKVKIIKNAVYIQKFAYDPAVRLEVRHELGLEQAFVVGHVGRFMPQKNHAFLLDIFQCVHTRQTDARLLLVGNGPLREETERKAKALGIYDAVIFAGITDYPENMYQAMDVFCFPSLFEGLGLAAIEAQTNGLPVVVSAEVPQEAELTDRVHFLPLSASPDQWSEEIVSCGKLPRCDMSQAVRNAGYDIEVESKKLEQYYLELYSKIRRN